MSGGCQTCGGFDYKHDPIAHGSEVVDDRAVRLAITQGWLVEEVDEHTCGTDSGGYYGHHEPGCGQVPLMTVGELLALFDALSALGIPINRAPEELPKLLAATGRDDIPVRTNEQEF